MFAQYCPEDHEEVVISDVIYMDPETTIFRCRACGREWSRPTDILGPAPESPDSGEIRVDIFRVLGHMYREAEAKANG